MEAVMGSQGQTQPLALNLYFNCFFHTTALSTPPWVSRGARASLSTWKPWAFCRTGTKWWTLKNSRVLAPEQRKEENCVGTITEPQNTFELEFSSEWDYHTCFTDEDANAGSGAQLFLQLCLWTWDLHADGLELAVSASSCPIQGQEPFGCRWGGLRVGFAGPTQPCPV